MASEAPHDVANAEGEAKVAGQNDGHMPASTADMPEASSGNAQSSNQKAPRKRTKTGCLTCRKRRIKCGEERPVCNNCIKSKRVCEGYSQRVVFKHPGNYRLPGQMMPEPGAFNQYPHPFTGVSYQPYATMQGLAGGQPLQPLAPRPYNPGFPGNFDPSQAGYPASPPLEQGQGMPAFLPNGQQYIQPPPADWNRTQQYQLQQWQNDGLEEVYPANDESFGGQVIDDRWASAPIPSLASSNDSRRYDVDGFGFVHSTAIRSNDPNHASEQRFGFRPAEEDDDLYDVDSDEEMEPPPPVDTQHDIGTMLAVSTHLQERQPRTFIAYLDEANMLATYRPSLNVTPLADPKIAKIFCHFITATGPSLSINERHATVPTGMFSGLPIPPSQQGLWTYKLPTMALGNQALLHAVLALACLHISKLQQSDPYPALKHYHYALRRVAKSVGLPQKRKEVPILAATLLLGFYEVLTAEHGKWNSHLAGARQLVLEVDFARMTRELRTLRAEAKRIQANELHGFDPTTHGRNTIEEFLPDKEWELDEKLISTLSGIPIQYDYHGLAAAEAPSVGKIYTTRDFDDYQVKTDLFWFYAKQDIFQSMLSGNSLLMPYDRWIYCPPRAQIGRIDAVYGTCDHLYLLLARLADFGGRDQKRKLRAVKANGGSWKPPPGFGPPPGMPPGGPPGQSGPPKQPLPKGPPSSMPGGPPPGVPMGTGPGPNSSPPMMMGMMPPTGPTKMPEAFDEYGPRKPPATKDAPLANEGKSLEQETMEAEAEWSSIAAALDTFFHVTGPDFAPLPADSVPPITTPFGPALQYRTHTIAVVWAFYYTGRILLARLKPSMPPAAMVAVGVAARETLQPSQAIGKICAGLYYPQQHSLTTGNLNPVLGSALIESTLPLFFAAVQYTDNIQRAWTISKLREIAHLTGWQSSAAIAAGCETAWERAYKAGRGPPYLRTMDANNKDGRVSGKGSDPSKYTPNEHSDSSNDRRFITVNKSTRVHWALGLLALESDMDALELADK